MYWRGTPSYVDDKVEVSEAAIKSSRDAWMSTANQRILKTGRVDAHAPRAQVQNSRAVLKQEVESARRAIVHLLHRQNVLLPVSRLPTELLSRVFLELCKEIAGDSQMGHRSPVDGWLVVTRVCCDWRSTALNCANLWSDVPLYFGEKLARLFLSRSKAAAISLPVLKKTQVGSWQYKLIGEQLHRVKNIEFEHGATDIAFCFDLLKTRTPERLEKLSLKPPKRYTFTHEDAQILARASRLQHIVFYSISFSWNVLPWSRLRTLDIFITSPDSATADFALLAESLASAAVLEELHLSIHKCPFKAIALSKSGVIKLLQLRSFTFTGFAIDFKHLSDAIQMPATASLNITLYSDSRGAAEAALLSTLLREHSGHEQPQPHQCVQEIQLSASRYESRSCLEAWQSTGDIELMHKRTDAFIKVSLPLLLTSLESELPALCKNVGLESLRQLRLHLLDGDICDWDKGTWHAMFSSACNVQSVHVSGVAVGRFFEALATPLDTVPPPSDAKHKGASSAKRKGTGAKRKSTTGAKHKHTSHRVLFPLLANVCLSHYEDSYPRAMDLPKWFKGRAQHAPIAELDIMESRVDERALSELYKVKGLEVNYSERERSDGECDECEGDGCSECMGSDWEGGPRFGWFF